MPEFQALPPVRREALLFFDTDHGARLRAQLKGLRLEKHRAADRAEQPALGVADRIDGKMFRHGGLHRVHDRNFGQEGKRVADHDVGEPLLRAAEEHLAHHDHTGEALLFVHHPEVGDKGARDQSSQGPRGFGDGRGLGENRQRRVHQPADGLLGKAVVLHPLPAVFLRGRGEHELPPRGRQSAEHTLPLGRAEQLDDFLHEVVGIGRQQVHGVVGVFLEDLREEAADLRVVLRRDGGWVRWIGHRGGCHHSPNSAGNGEASRRAVRASPRNIGLERCLRRLGPGMFS